MIDQMTQLVTPAIAAEWIGSMRPNRALKLTTVLAYARQMKAGLWGETGEPIKFDNEGCLLDGQHRLQALISADVDLELCVVSGLDIISQNYMDSGIKRTIGDALSLDGLSYGMQLAATVNVLWGYRRTDILMPPQGHERPSATEVKQFLKQYPGVINSVEFAQHHRKSLRPFASDATHSSLHFLFDLHSYDDNYAFWNSFMTGEMLEVGDPIFQLRDRLIKNSSQIKKLPVTHIRALYMKTWNSFLAGERVHRLYWQSGGLHPEPFPYLRPNPLKVAELEAA